METFTTWFTAHINVSLFRIGNFFLLLRNNCPYTGIYCRCNDLHQDLIAGFLSILIGELFWLLAAYFTVQDQDLMPGRLVLSEEHINISLDLADVMPEFSFLK